MHCTICEGEENDGAWITVIVTENAGAIVAGHLCSVKCLTDYVVEIHRMMLDEEEEK